MKGIFRITFAALALSAATIATTQAQQPVIKVGTEGAFQPWTFTTSDGKLAGLDIDLTNNLCERVKVKCEITSGDFTSLIPGLNAKKYDMIIDAINITEQREKVVSFTRPYAIESYSFAILGDKDLESLPGTGTKINLDTDKEAFENIIPKMAAALKGKTIGAQAASTNLAFVEKHFKDSSDIRQYKTTEQHDLDLQSGRIDAIFEARTAIIATAKQNGFSEMHIVGPIFSGSEMGRGAAIAFRKSDTELRDKFDKALSEAIADGTMSKISMKWLGIDLSPQK